jgi:hypothetical protein
LSPELVKIAAMPLINRLWLCRDSWYGKRWRLIVDLKTTLPKHPGRKTNRTPVTSGERLTSGSLEAGYWPNLLIEGLAYRSFVELFIAKIMF